MGELQQHAFSPNGIPLCVYGEPADPLRVHVQTSLRNHTLTDEIKVYNKSVSSVRVSVEWLFGEIVKYFKFVDF